MQYNAVDLYRQNISYLNKIRRRYKWLTRIRPQILAIPLYKLLKPYEHRRIVNIDGLNLFLDPFSHLGKTLLDTGTYEPSIRNIIEEHLGVGSCFLDIGSNEGYYAALACRHVGPNGLVIAVEPQSSLTDIIKINILLNGSAQYRIYQKAIAKEGGKQTILNLWPLSNTGAASLIHKYRWGRKGETVSTISTDQIDIDCAFDRIDIAKVDVEGYEYEVVDSLLPLIQRNKIQALLIDYHFSILAKMGISVSQIEQGVLERGGKVIWRENQSGGGYVLYHMS